MSSFNFLNKFSNNIKELLKKPNVTLDEVLQENEIVNEYKEQKDHVVKFFKDAQFQNLLIYLNKDHNNLEEKKKAYKFPQIACEIFASASNQVIDFFKQMNEGILVNFHALFNEFFDSKGNIKKQNINYTRAGYIYKIIQALISKNPQIFVQEIYENNKFFKALLKHSYCISTVNILNCLILGVQKIDNQDKDNSYDEWLQKTQEQRFLYVNEIMGQTLGTSKSQELYQVNKNLGHFISQMLQTDYKEKDKFLTIFFKDFFFEFGQNFIDTFFENSNQISGNIFNLGLTYIIENQTQNYFNLKNLNEITLLCFTILEDYTQRQYSKKQQKRTTTFNKEVLIPSQKIYKFTNSIQKQIEIYIKNSDYQIIKNSKFSESLFHLYTLHPFNNVLHFKITEILQKIIETKDENLIDFIFFNNKSFTNILNEIVSDYKNLQQNELNEKSCYLGFIKNIQSCLVQAGFDKQDNNSTYESFIQEFIQSENKKEQSIFQEIDHNKQEIQLEAQYDFSIEEIQDRYSDFLGLAEESKLQNLNEEDEEKQDVIDLDELEKEQEEEEKEIQTQELREELKNVMDQEETAYHDLKFWKNQNFYEIEALMNELNQQLKFCISFLFILLFFIFKFIKNHLKFFLDLYINYSKIYKFFNEKITMQNHQKQEEDLLCHLCGEYQPQLKFKSHVLRCYAKTIKTNQNYNPSIQTKDLLQLLSQKKLSTKEYNSLALKSFVQDSVFECKRCNQLILKAKMTKHKKKCNKKKKKLKKPSIEDLFKEQIKKIFNSEQNIEEQQPKKKKIKTEKQMKKIKKSVVTKPTVEINKRTNKIIKQFDKKKSNNVSHLIKTAKKCNQSSKRFSNKIINKKKNIKDQNKNNKNQQKKKKKISLKQKLSLKELMKKFTEIQKEDPLNFSKYSRNQSINQRAKSQMNSPQIKKIFTLKENQKSKENDLQNFEQQTPRKSKWVNRYKQKPQQQSKLKQMYSEAKSVVNDEASFFTIFHKTKQQQIDNKSQRLNKWMRKKITLSKMNSLNDEKNQRNKSAPSDKFKRLRDKNKKQKNSKNEYIKMTSSQIDMIKQDIEDVSNFGPIDYYGQANYEIFQQILHPCEFCSRTFLPQRLQKHQKVCQFNNNPQSRFKQLFKLNFIKLYIINFQFFNINHWQLNNK